MELSLTPLRYTVVSWDLLGVIAFEIYRAKKNIFLFANLQLCQLAEFDEVTGFAIRVHEDNKRLLRVKLQEGKVTLLDN